MGSVMKWRKKKIRKAISSGQGQDDAVKAVAATFSS